MLRVRAGPHHSCHIVHRQRAKNYFASLTDSRGWNFCFQQQNMVTASRSNSYKVPKKLLRENMSVIILWMTNFWVSPIVVLHHVYTISELTSKTPHHEQEKPVLVDISDVSNLQNTIHGRRKDDE